MVTFSCRMIQYSKFQLLLGLAVTYSSDCQPFASCFPLVILSKSNIPSIVNIISFPKDEYLQLGTFWTTCTSQCTCIHCTSSSKMVHCLNKYHIKRFASWRENSMKIILYILKNQAQDAQKTNSFIQGKSDTINMVQVKPNVTVVISQKTKCLNIVS